MAVNPHLRPILLVGGGTGGHIMPLIAIGEELTTRQLPFIFVGAKNGREEKIVAGLGWRFAAIEAGKWRRDFSLSNLFSNLIDVSRVIIGFFQALQLLVRSRVRVVFSKGGYVALPVVLAAKLLGRRLIIHESDVVMGLTNRISSRMATSVLTAFDTKVYPNADQRYRQVGIPVRRALRQAAKLKAPQKSRPLIFVIGGIQGSSALNDLIKPIIPNLIQRYDLVHVTGEVAAAGFRQLRLSLGKEQNRYKPSAFIDRELPYYYQTADLIISRASATTIVEASIFSKALYLVPLPTAAGNHQVANARLLEKAQAVIVREQDQLTAEMIHQDIERLLADTVRLQEMGQRLHQYFDEEQTLPKIMELITE